jgi:hypothetical protein
MLVRGLRQGSLGFVSNALSQRAERLLAMRTSMSLRLLSRMADTSNPAAANTW